MFKVGDEVKVLSDDSVGIVKTVKNLEDFTIYEVLVNSNTRSFFESQLKLYRSELKDILTADNLKALLTSTLLTQIDNDSLYSINSAKIDFIPYQFRPVLKVIKSETPKILIADGVGVGKTIEAGLIIKELQARQDIKSILIICPKPLITENKWVSEMKRFDCHFTNMDGKLLKHCINECNKDGIWPEEYNQCVVPFSLFDEELVFGKETDKIKKIGLTDLIPFPKFDLVIVDEAHHIRNQSTNRYKGVKFFLDNCDSAILLTATPLQMGNKDLFTLLNLLRPELILDYNTFESMSEPNKHISKAASIVRKDIENWKMLSLEELTSAKETGFGSAIYTNSPNYIKAITLLNKENITNEERVELIDTIEQLHTFSSLINRTRRRDIGNFTIRKVETLKVSLTEYERELYDKFLSMVAKILIQIHGNRCIKFMMSTLLRQASSSLHALAPFMEEMIEFKYKQLNYIDEHDVDENEVEKTLSQISSFINNDADYNEIKKLCFNLPKDDNKINSLLNIIKQKSIMPNNKVMVFSAFRHTLDYIYKILQNNNIRAAIIHGGIKDEERVELRERFKANRNDPKAIDVLLFSDVGCEGLDYQFCDCLINFDIPWNPQKIEQRIGRIDRKGQLSDSVLIYNMVISQTVDEEIYDRCLQRINVFNSEIGDSEEIIGNVTQEITDLAIKYILNPNETKEKFNQLSDNTIRLIQEQQRLEENQKDFFGLDVSKSKMNKEVEQARNVFLSKGAIKILLNNYLESLDIKNALIEVDNKLILKLPKEVKEKLYLDFLKLDRVRTKSYYIWEEILKSSATNVYLSLDGEQVSSNSIFVDINHPFVKQALLKNDFSSNTSYIKSKTNILSPGIYPFEIYLWSYRGIKINNKLKIISNTNLEDYEWFNILFDSDNAYRICSLDNSLEIKHYKQWLAEKKSYIDSVSSNINYKIQILEDNYLKRVDIIKKALESTNDERIIRMKEAELKNIKTKKDLKIDQLKNLTNKIDILTTRLVQGVLIVEE